MTSSANDLSYLKKESPNDLAIYAGAESDCPISADEVTGIVKAYSFVHA